jgi:hypothetical protein
MTPIQPVLDGLCQLLLLVFVLMTLVGIAGGNPGAVITSLIDLVARLVTGLLQAFIAVLPVLVRAIISLASSVMRATDRSSLSDSSRRIR